jgi:hypothetical protein
MKELAIKAFKFIGASVGLLVTAYTLGWSGAITLHNLFKTEKAEAVQYVEGRIAEQETKFMAIRQADLDGIHGKMDILIDQNKLIISQNYRTRKAVEKVIE